MRRFSARSRKYMVALGGIGLLIGLRYLADRHSRPSGGGARHAGRPGRSGGRYQVSNGEG